MKWLVLISTIIAALATASTPPVAQFRVEMDKDAITLSDVKGGGILAKTTFERWGVGALTQDTLRRVALDVTAAVITGDGRRERSVTPNARVYTLAEKGKAPHVTATFEHGAIFFVLSDTQTNGRYEALISMAKIGEISLPTRAGR